MTRMLLCYVNHQVNFHQAAALSFLSTRSITPLLLPTLTFCLFPPLSFFATSLPTASPSSTPSLPKISSSSSRSYNTSQSRKLSCDRKPKSPVMSSLTCSFKSANSIFMLYASSPSA